MIEVVKRHIYLALYQVLNDFAWKHLSGVKFTKENVSEMVSKLQGLFDDKFIVEETETGIKLYQDGYQIIELHFGGKVKIEESGVRFYKSLHSVHTLYFLKEEE